jgi:hypothetical protein
MREYSFYAKNDCKQERLGLTLSRYRIQAAKYFAERKQLSLKNFLAIYNVTR